MDVFVRVAHDHGAGRLSGVSACRSEAAGARAEADHVTGAR